MPYFWTSSSIRKLNTLAWAWLKGDGFFSATDIERIMNFNSTRIGEFGVSDRFLLDFQGSWY